MRRFCFTQTQIGQLLHDAIKMHIEYRDQHGKGEEYARLAAVSEMLEGLIAGHELAGQGELEEARAHICPGEALLVALEGLLRWAPTSRDLQHWLLVSDAEVPEHEQCRELKAARLKAETVHRQLTQE